MAGMHENVTVKAVIVNNINGIKRSRRLRMVDRGVQGKSRKEYNQLSLYMTRPLDEVLVSYTHDAIEKLKIGVLFGDLRKESLNIYTKQEYIQAINRLSKKHNKILKKLKVVLTKEAPLDIIKFLRKHKVNEEEIIAAALRERVYSLLLQKNRREATEELVKAVKDKFIIYTVRDDEITEMWIYSDGIYIPQAKTVIREFCRKILSDAYTKYLASEVIDKIATDTYINFKDFFDKESIEEIAVKNGILNIFTRELDTFTPDKIFFSKMPITYDPSKKCPAIEKHFEEVLKNGKTEKKLLKELFGYLLLKDYRFEKAFMLYGDGRNGKSKTISLMKTFIGAENCISRSIQQLEEEQYALGDLFKKQANLCGDISKKALKTTSNLKQLRGRDVITASRKFKLPVVFINYAKLIFCANEFPITHDDTDAFWNSWVMFDFPYKFVSEKEYKLLENKENCKIADVNILDKISTDDELSGLLNISLDALKALIDRKDFSYSKTADDVKNIWLRKSSSLNGFLLDEIKEDWDSKISKKDFRQAYAIYCKKHKIRSVSDKVLKNMLAEHGVSDERAVDYDGKQVWVWSGIEFSKGSKDSNGFSTRIEHKKRAIDTNTLSNLTTLTNLETLKIGETEEDKLDDPFKSTGIPKPIKK